MADSDLSELTDLQRLVDAADDAALLRAVDGLAASGQWDALADLARRCRDAVELGKQLWGVAMHIDYRLAWEGPPAHAAAVLRPGAGRFTLGPLTEVAAGSHDWAALSPHLSEPATIGAVAQERVIRGEDLRGQVASGLAELPLRLAAWEPSYALPRYRDRSAVFAAPAVPEPRGSARPMPAPATLPPDDAAAALHDAVATWASESEGHLAVACVHGDGLDAIGALASEALVAELEPADALALLQWAAASGGARGRRRGGAAGRFAAWWTAAALAGVPWPDDASDDPAFPDELGQALAELTWLRWSHPEPEAGWVLRIAAADPADELAWAIDARDAVPDEIAARPGVADAGR